MPHLRKVVDSETGQIYRAETTKQAKRRYQRESRASYQPTIGQINAADIWNKQEEKIKREKEREEKKKRNKIKQDVKDARFKEIQQEKLKAGRITIEDTWGKVSASQNRLHRFFAAPAKPTTSHVTRSEGNCEGQEEEEEEEEKEEEGGEEVQNVDDAQIEADSNEHKEDTVLPQGLEAIFTASPLTLDESSSQQRSDQCSPPTKELTILYNNRKVGSPSSSRGITKRKHSDVAQTYTTMMPPPPKRIKPSTELRTPLMEVTRSQVIIRRSQNPDPEIDEKAYPVSTQVVRDTLCGLCSQDFEDDFFEHDKENDSPKKVAEQELKAMDSDTEPASNTCCIDLENFFDDECDFDDLDFDVDEFDDGDIDDEMLIALAANHQLKQELFASSSRHTSERLVISLPCTTSDHHEHTMNRGELADYRDLTSTLKLGDSFTMDGLDDEVLLEGLEIFENARTLPAANQIEHSKKRRVLPWNKNPVDYDTGDRNDMDRLTQSLSSQNF